MSLTPFDGMTPTRVLWVSPTGPAKGATGAATSPFPTIQAAVDHATPGTAIMVKAGTYNGTVLFKQDQGGTATAPIWLISADGPQKAHIIAPTTGAAAIGGGGVSNIVVEGFWVTGGKNGIQFSQDGFTFTKMINNIVVEGNVIDGAQQDGIKANGGFGVYVLNNHVSNGEGDQGIDFVAVNNGVISNNEINNITGSTAIFAKGGSTNIVVSNNYIHDLANDGISMGNRMGDEPWMPGYTGYQVKNMTVTGNDIVNVGGRALVVDGAVNSSATGNYLGTTGKYFAIDVKADVSPVNGVNTTFLTQNVTLSGNTFASSTKTVNFNPGYGSGVSQVGNVVSHAWAGHAGVQPVTAPSIVGVPTGVTSSGVHTTSTAASSAPLISSSSLNAYLLGLENSAMHPAAASAASSYSSYAASASPYSYFSAYQTHASYAPDTSTAHVSAVQTTDVHAAASAAYPTANPYGLSVDVSHLPQYLLAYEHII